MENTTKYNSACQHETLVIPEPEPCPFCGCTDTWTYICSTAAKVECNDCGASIKDNCVRTTYKTYGELPEWAKATAKKGVHYLNEKGEKVESYWVIPTLSFFHEGITERWNRRV